MSLKEGTSLLLQYQQKLHQAVNMHSCSQFDDFNNQPSHLSKPEGKASQPWRSSPQTSAPPKHQRSSFNNTFIDQIHNKTATKTRLPIDTSNKPCQNHQRHEKEKTMSSLLSRKRDLTYLLFFLIHIPIIFCPSPSPPHPQPPTH